MTTYTLSEDDSVAVSLGPLRIELAASVPNARLSVNTEAAAEGVVCAGSRTVVILPSVSQFSVDVLASDDTFPSGSSAAITVTKGRTSDDSEHQIEVGQVDLGGTRERQLLIGSSDGSRWTLTTPFQTAQRSLHGLAGAARAEARKQLVDWRPEAAGENQVVVAVDGSASLVQLGTNDALGAVVEVLLGVSQAIADQGAVHLVILSANGPTWWPHPGISDASEVAAWVISEVIASNPLIGCDITPLKAPITQVGTKAARQADHIFFITDAPPSLPRSASHGTTWHGVVVAHGLKAPDKSGTYITVFDTPDGTDLTLRQLLQDDPNQLTQQVGALLSTSITEQSPQKS